MKNSKDAALDGSTYIENNQRRKISNPQSNKSKFYFQGIVVGIFSAIGMSLLSVALTQVGAISTPVIMLTKYIILGVALFWILASHRRALGENYRFVKGILLGGLVTFTASVTSAVANTFLYTSQANLENSNPTDPSSLGGAFINGGVVFMECLVFGMILTFICLQFLKRGRPGE